MKRLAVAAVLLVGAGSLHRVEQDFGALRSLKDQADVATERAGDPMAGGHGRARAYETQRATVAQGLAQATARTDEDRRAIDTMRGALASDLPERLSASDPAAATTPCDADLAPLADGPDGWDVLRAHLYRCFGATARSLRVGDETVDHLTVLGRLEKTDAPAARRRMFLSLEPLWRVVNGDNGARSPYRQLLRLGAARPSSIASELAALGVPAGEVEGWLVQVLEAWRAGNPGELEPWDFWHVGHEAARVLDPHIGRDRLEPITLSFYRALGADPLALHVLYDLVPRPGKTPVAYTTFGSRVPDARGVWRAGEVWIFATYREGGLGNLVELLHETGHAVHIAAIRSRAAFMDWPDATTFTEALADVTALEAYEPSWQRRYLGVEAPARDALRAKYAPVMLDVAWGLFEMRLARDPEVDPNRVWTELTSRHLGIRPHPEWSWWALRGQLVDSPGYLVHYAVGAIVAADLRSRCRAERGPFARPDPGYYDWLAARLYRFGLARPTRAVLLDFLGRPVSPKALLADLDRLRAP